MEGETTGRRPEAPLLYAQLNVAGEVTPADITHGTHRIISKEKPLCLKPLVWGQFVMQQ
jgi:hypothetical protein